MATQSFTETWLTGPQSTAFYTRTYRPSAPVTTKAVLVAVHGFAEHVGRYTHYHPLLAKEGIAVFAFDQRGFGRTALDAAKSKESAWGKTCWDDQMADIEWAIGHVKKEFAGTPIFLQGHSMGGAEALGFACQEEKSSHREPLSYLAGVIATSPLITQTNPAPRILKWVGSKASILMPNALIPAPVKAEELSHDEDFNKAYMNDPMIKATGSLRGVSDMLTKGEELLNSGYKRWPKKLPVLIVHGTGDQVTSHKSSEAFCNAIDADDKRIILVEGGYHELQNEPDGVKERLAGDIVKFVEARLPANAPLAGPPERTAVESTGETAPADGKGEEVAPETEGPAKANL